MDQPGVLGLAGSPDPQDFMPLLYGQVRAALARYPTADKDDVLSHLQIALVRACRSWRPGAASPAHHITIALERKARSFGKAGKHGRIGSGNFLDEIADRRSLRSAHPQASTLWHLIWNLSTPTRQLVLAAADTDGGRHKHNAVCAMARLFVADAVREPGEMLPDCGWQAGFALALHRADPLPAQPKWHSTSDIKRAAEQIEELPPLDVPERFNHLMRQHSGVKIFEHAIVDPDRFRLSAMVDGIRREIAACVPEQEHAVVL